MFTRTWVIVIGVALVACATPTTTPTVTPTLAHPTIRVVMPTPLTPSFTPSPTLPPDTATPPPPRQPTPRARQFDSVSARDLLAVLFPDFTFTPEGDVFRVNADPNWTMWLTSRIEGCFTQDETAELATIVVNDAPSTNESVTRGAFLALFQWRENRVQVLLRAFLFPLALVPPAFDARIERATDFDHDGREELLIVTVSETMGVSTAAAFLYWWNDQAFVPLWSATLAEDNTGALNQPEYFATEATLVLADVDGDGWDEIVVEGTRIDYARDAQGLADTDHETRRRNYRHVYRWNGVAFVLDLTRATPVPP